MKRTFLTLAAAVGMTGAMALAQTAPANSQNQATPANQSASANAGESNCAGQSGPESHASMRQYWRQQQDRYMQSLNLTPEQKAQSKTIFEASRQETEPLVKQLRAERNTLKSAVEADNREQIRQLSADVGKIQGQILASRLEARAKFMTTLTPSQKAKAEAFHPGFHESSATK